MEIPVSPPSNTVEDLNPTVETSCSFSKSHNNENPPIILNKKKKKKTFETCNKASSSSGVSTRFLYKRRNPKVVLGSVIRRGGGFGHVGDRQMEGVALPLGMSFAAIVAQVMDRDEEGDKMSVDHLTKICASAVRESLSNVFGDKFDFFARNFEKSFGSTLSTLRLINEASNQEAYHIEQLDAAKSESELNSNNGNDSVSSSWMNDCHSESEMLSSSSRNQMQMDEAMEDNLPLLNRELSLHGHINQPFSAPCPSGSLNRQLSTIEKSVMEHTRSNDLKTVEIGLTMRKLKLKEAELALHMHSNHLERTKLEVGMSKASFKIEKFKTQLEDTRHAELLKKCIDCLVAGLFIMSASILYGAYVFSYQRITDATESCNPSAKDSNSWWMPRPFSSFNSGWNTLRCHIQVASQMLFGILIILAVAYLLLQRSSTSRQTMPVTFILMLLGAACGFAGKFCVDTLGGNGLHWLLYWETMCLLHFFANVCTATLFCALHGPLNVSQGMKDPLIFPYWIRRTIFYAILLVVLPLCCGMLPFAHPGEWKDHLLQRATDSLFTSDEL